MADYHGPVPVTENDVDMAKDHLKKTYKAKKALLDLTEDKIDDHAKAKTVAKKAGNKKSWSYNDIHEKGHEKDSDKLQGDLSQIKTSMKTAAKVKPQTYDDVRKKKVAIMARKADEQNG